MKIPDAKAAVDQEWEKLGNLPAWQSTQNEEQTFGVFAQMCVAPLRGAATSK